MSEVIDDIKKYLHCLAEDAYELIADDTSLVGLREVIESNEQMGYPERLHVQRYYLIPSYRVRRMGINYEDKTPILNDKIAQLPSANSAMGLLSVVSTGTRSYSSNETHSYHYDPIGALMLDRTSLLALAWGQIKAYRNILRMRTNIQNSYIAFYIVKVNSRC